MVVHGLIGKLLPAMRMPVFKARIFSVFQQIKLDQFINCSCNQLSLWRSYGRETSPIFLRVVQVLSYENRRGREMRVLFRCHSFQAFVAPAEISLNTHLHRYLHVAWFTCLRQSLLVPAPDTNLTVPETPRNPQKLQ